MITFNIKKLIDELGGVTKVAKLLNKHRTAPYKWIAAQSVSTDILGKIKERYPDININDYFEVKNGRSSEAKRSTRKDNM